MFRNGRCIGNQPGEEMSIPMCGDRVRSDLEIFRVDGCEPSWGCVEMAPLLRKLKIVAVSSANVN